MKSRDCTAPSGYGALPLTHTRVRDFHTDEGDEQPVGLGQLIPRIVSGADDLSAMVTLPCAVSSIKMPPGALVLDNTFIPTIQAVRVSGLLGAFSGEVQGLLATRAADLAGRIGSPEQSGIADVAEFMMLQMLNRYQMQFTHRSQLHTLHPEAFYRDLVGLLGELMTFTEGNRLPCTVEPYNHRDLTATFTRTVIPELRRALNTVLVPRAQNLPLFFQRGPDRHHQRSHIVAVLQAGTGSARQDALRPGTTPVHPAVESGRYRQNPQRGQRAGAGYSAAHAYRCATSVAIPRRLCLLRTGKRHPGLAGRDKSGRTGAAYLRQLPRSEPPALGYKGISE